VDDNDVGFAGMSTTSASIFKSGIPRTRPLTRASTSAPSDKRPPRLRVSAGASARSLTICLFRSGHAFVARRCLRYLQSGPPVRPQSGWPSRPCLSTSPKPAYGQSHEPSREAVRPRSFDQRPSSDEPLHCLREAVLSAATSSFLVMVERPLMPTPAARSTNSSLLKELRPFVVSRLRARAVCFAVVTKRMTFGDYWGPLKGPLVNTRLPTAFDNGLRSTRKQLAAPT
jgi:hypothetical protein